MDISFAAQNWRKAVLDKTRPGQFVRKHVEAMAFTALAEELRTGDVAVVGSEEYADWSKQLLAWQTAREKLGAYLVEVGLAEEGETAEFDAGFFRRQLEDKLRDAAAAADVGYPDNEGLVIDPETGIPSLKPHRSKGQRPSAKRLERGVQGSDARAVADGNPRPHGVLGGVVAPVRPRLRQRAQASRPVRPLRDHDVREGHEHGPVRRPPGTSPV
ncbi:hypothetical protein ACFRCX_06080 [Streptomyces sp. NPDC056652]|uniref:hypothetical protein n=1 Tax=Streptomyces sp. NPDC056652 TaxID=3345893 RepID=UPI00368E64D1